MSSIPEPGRACTASYPLTKIVVTQMSTRPSKTEKEGEEEEDDDAKQVKAKTNEME